MESLKVTNFITIKEATLNVKKINIVIGEQATGKSIIAKLLYFFQDLLFSTLINSIEVFSDQREFKNNIIHKFEQLFPRYSWGKQEFELIYTVAEYEILVNNKKSSKSQKYILSLNYSKSLGDLFSKRKRLFSNIENQIKESQLIDIDDLIDKRRMFIEQYLINSLLEKYFKQTFFIPASRSCFTFLQKSIFSLLASPQFLIDPLLIEFASIYERVKSLYMIINDDDNPIVEDKKDQKLIKQIQNICEKIYKGKYAYERDQDWIYTSEQQKINLSNASSGQQESLPMLLVLSVFPFLAIRQSKIFPSIFFIEEPEAHLFPFAQKYMIDLFSLLYHEKSCNFFITTHSPYILTAFNNKIMAGNKQSTKIDYPIDYDDIAAYTINEGILETILEEDVHLIGTNIIDSVSDELGSEFDDLLND